MSQHSRSSHRTTLAARSVTVSLAGTALAAFAVLALVALCAPAPALAADVWVDAGHGGKYSGAYYGGTREADINLGLARAVNNELVRRGHRTGMTRTTNTTVERSVPAWHWDDDGVHLRYCDSRCAHSSPIRDLQPRVDYANRWGADVFISIHANAAGSSSANGVETYYPNDSETDRLLSTRLATLVQREIIAETGMRDRDAMATNFYVIRWSNMPAVLIEAGFVSNASDRARMLSTAYRTAFAHAVVDALETFLAEDPFKPQYPRRSGSDRYGTAAAAARASWPTGADTVILASGEAWPDSLAASPLSAALNAPVLLTAGSSLPTATADAIRALHPSHLVVVGGDGAIATATVEAASAVASLGPDAVERLAGADRYETAVRIAQRIGVPASGRVLAVSGDAFPDAVSASAYAARTGTPILVVTRDTIPTVTAAYLTANNVGVGALTVVGGEAAVGWRVAESLKRIGTVTRLYGPDRYATNLAVMKAYWPSGSIAPYVATGVDFPDALVAGSVAGRANQPVLLLGRKYLAASWREHLANFEARYTGFTVVGGSAAVPPLMDWELKKALAR